MKIFTIAFFGHRYIEDYFKLEKLLEKQIRNLLSQNEYIEFLVGRNGEFDILVSSVVRKVKKKYRDDNSQLILMLPYKTAEYLNNKESFDNFYDMVEISSNSYNSHPKSAIQIRNKEMIDRSDLVICFIKEKGGAYTTLKYAENQNKNIINLADMI